MNLLLMLLIGLAIGLLAGRWLASRGTSGSSQQQERRAGDDAGRTPAVVGLVLALVAGSVAGFLGSPDSLFGWMFAAIAIAQLGNAVLLVVGASPGRWTGYSIRGQALQSAGSGAMAVLIAAGDRLSPGVGMVVGAVAFVGVTAGMLVDRAARQRLSANGA